MCLIHVYVCVDSSERAEPEQADHVDPVVDRRRVRAQLAAADRVHAARRVPTASDPVDGRVVQGVRVRAHDGHVDHVHQPAAVRLAQHQLPARHIRHMPADVVLLRRPEAAAAAQTLPVRGHGLPRPRRPAGARCRVRGAVPAEPSPSPSPPPPPQPTRSGAAPAPVPASVPAPAGHRDHRRRVRGGAQRPAVQHQLPDHADHGHVPILAARLQRRPRRTRLGAVRMHVRRTRHRDRPGRLRKVSHPTSPRVPFAQNRLRHVPERRTFVVPSPFVDRH